MCVVCLSAAEKRKTIPTFIRKKRRALLLTTRRGLIFQGTLRLVLAKGLFGYTPKIRVRK